MLQWCEVVEPKWTTLNTLVSTMGNLSKKKKKICILYFVWFIIVIEIWKKKDGEKIHSGRKVLDETYWYCTMVLICCLQISFKRIYSAELCQSALTVPSRLLKHTVINAPASPETFPSSPLCLTGAILFRVMTHSRRFTAAIVKSPSV